MITYSNQKRHISSNFQEYLSIPGYSYSWLKNEQQGIYLPIKNTGAVQLGSLVDAILTEPSKVDMLSPLYNMARDIAHEIRHTFPHIEHFTKQVSLSGIAEYKGFKMNIRGRLDYVFEKNAVLDLKVTQSKNIPALIAFMGYENQMWNYCKLAEVQKAYLLIWSVPLKKLIIYPIDCSKDMNEFWSEKILKFGNI